MKRNKIAEFYEFSTFSPLIGHESCVSWVISRWIANNVVAVVENVNAGWIDCKQVIVIDLYSFS